MYWFLSTMKSSKLSKRPEDIAPYPILLCLNHEFLYYGLILICDDWKIEWTHLAEYTQQTGTCIVTHIKYSDAADEYLTKALLLYVVLISIWKRVFNSFFRKTKSEELNNQSKLHTGVQFFVFQILSHDVHGKSWVNDAKKNRNDQAIMTL